VKRKQLVVVLPVAFVLFVAAPVSKAGVLVAQCIESQTCWTSGLAWSHDLSKADLVSLGLGTTVPLTAVQTSEYVMRLGVTTLTFSTPAGPVVQTVPEFNGAYHNDPCNPCETDTVGTFSIPATATSATINGSFGNSQVNTSAGLDLYLGPPLAPAVKITLKSAPPNDEYLITAIPTMPTITATASIINVTPDPTPGATFTWTAHLSIRENGGTGPTVSYDQDILQNTTTTGNGTYTLTFQDPRDFRGGSLTLTAVTTVNGQQLTASTPSDLVIAGTNPQRSSIQSEVNSQVVIRSYYNLQTGDVQDVVNRIGCQESNQRQFNATADGGAGPVLVSFDNGIGVFQITNSTLFSTQPAVLFDWTQNVISGVTAYQTKVKTSLGYPGLLRVSSTYINFINNTVNPQRLAAGRAPITTIPAPGFTTTGQIGSSAPDQLLEDGVRGYNGFAGPAFLGISVLHEFEPDTNFLLTVPDNQLSTLSTNPNVWKRVCTDATSCSAARGSSGDPNYVNHVAGQSPQCGN